MLVIRSCTLAKDNREARKRTVALRIVGDHYPLGVRHSSTCSPTSNRSHLIVGSVQQTQFSSSQFCHGANRLSSDRYHVSVEPVNSSLLRYSSSSSSPTWNHIHGISSDVSLCSLLACSNYLSLSFLHLDCMEKRRGGNGGQNDFQKTEGKGPGFLCDAS